MKKEQIEADWGIAYPDECKQTVRPMGNLLDAIYRAQLTMDKEMFDFLFGEHSNLYYNSFENDFNRNLVNFAHSLNTKHYAKLANYIESITSTYIVAKHVTTKDIDRLLNANRYMLPTLLRDINYANYGGTLDENAILRWVVERKKGI